MLTHWSSAVSVQVGLTEGEIEGLRLAEIEGLLLGETEAEGDVDADGLLDGLMLGLIEGEALGDTEAEGDVDADCDLLSEIEGDMLGDTEGLVDAEGDAPAGFNAPDHKAFLAFLANVTVVAPYAPAVVLMPVATPIAPPFPAVQ